MYKNAFVAVMGVTFINFCSSALPPQVKTCPKSSPNIVDCLKNAMEALKPYLKSGEIAPGFKIEGIDPLYVGNISINQGFEVNHWGMKAYGISDFKVDKMRVNLNNFKIEMILTVPKVSMKAKYNLKWQLGALNLNGGGDGYAYLENVKVHLKLTGSRYLKGGDDHIKIDTVKFDVKPTNIRIRYENLFNGQKELEQVANEYINQNIDLITKDITPKIAQALETKILKVSNDVFERAPADEFFP